MNIISKAKDHAFHWKLGTGGYFSVISARPRYMPRIGALVLPAASWPAGQGMRDEWPPSPTAPHVTPLSLAAPHSAPWPPCVIQYGDQPARVNSNYSRLFEYFKFFILKLLDFRVTYIFITGFSGVCSYSYLN